MHLEQATVLADPCIAASVAGLRYISDGDTAGLSRRRHGKGFAYFGPDGTLITNKSVLARIRELAIPPAWTSVWISPFADAHLAATGRDARGRKQYRYHAEFLSVRDTAKYERLIAFADTLSHIREAVAGHMALRGVPRDRVLAIIVHLLEATLIRIGNEGYARDNGSFGLTTLRSRHVRITGSELRFLFQGKSGKTWRVNVNDRRVAKVIRACQDLPGQHLFQYLDEKSEAQRITSSDVNDYLRGITGRDITAKDFRTWAGTVEVAVALQALQVEGAGSDKKNVRKALERAAHRLGNTMAICRKCYVHPAILRAYENGEFNLKIPEHTSPSNESRLTAAENAVLSFLKQRLYL
jgi:DNA topoisomerase-1